MRVSLAQLLSDAVNEMGVFYLAEELNSDEFLVWIQKYPTQLVVLAVQAIWTMNVEKSLSTMNEGDKNNQEPLLKSLQLVERGLNVLADKVLTDLPVIQRRK